jgi:hypothetical protein
MIVGIGPGFEGAIAFLGPRRAEDIDHLAVAARGAVELPAHALQR